MEEVSRHGGSHAFQRPVFVYSKFIIGTKCHSSIHPGPQRHKGETFGRIRVRRDLLYWTAIKSFQCICVSSKRITLPSCLFSHALRLHGVYPDHGS